MLGPFKSGQPLSEKEKLADQPTLENAFARVDQTTVRRRYRAGFHQGYVLRATPETRRIDNRRIGERDDD